MSTNSDRLISVDLGRAYCKAVRAGRTGAQAVSFPSAIARQAEADLTGFAGWGADRRAVVQYSGARHVVGHDAFLEARAQRTVTRRVDLSGEDRRILFYAALGEAYERSGSLDVIASVPPGWWDLREQFRDLLAGVHEFTYSGALMRFEVNNVTIIPESLGTLALFILSTSGGEIIDTKLAAGRVLLVDIGGRTTDLIGFDALQPIRSSIFTHDLGIIDVRERLQARLEQQYNRGASTFDAAILDRAIRTRVLLHSGDYKQIGPIVDDCLLDLAQNIYSTVTERLEGGVNFNTILVTGGGAPLVGPYLIEALGHVDVRWPDERPWLANAEGAYRYGLFRRHMEQARI